MPAPIAAKLSATLATLRDLPEVKARFAAAGTVPLLTGPAGLERLLESDVPKWQRVVAEAGIRGE
jgi:tripartite-type tricarboxylate transporter receptor subunit TctC